MRIVQFMHPGREFVPQVHMGVGETCTIDWNPERHARRLIQTMGGYVETANATDLHHAELAFWNEWEAATDVTRLQPLQFPNPHARYLYRPLSPLLVGPNVQPQEECCFNTDPCVFGQSFKYALCRQERFRGLKELNANDLIVFGSTREGTFYLDTVFVVASQAEEYHGADAGHEIECSEEYRALTLDHLQTMGDLSFYRGVRWEGRAHHGDMFSFTPAKLYEPADESCRQRCPLNFAALNTHVQGERGFNERVQAVAYLNAPNVLGVAEIWREIVCQVVDNGFVLGVSFNWPGQQ